MIPAEEYGLNTTLAAMLRSLHREIRAKDTEAVNGITQNLAYILGQTVNRPMQYNALQLGLAIDVTRKDLPGVSRDTYRPHHYMSDIETIAQEGIAHLDFVLPLPLEFGNDETPYALAVRTYPVTIGERVPGITVNLGDTIPHHVFFYASEVQSFTFGHAAAAEFPCLLKTKGW